MATLYLLLIVLTIYPTVLRSWLVPQPAENTWVTLSKALGQENFCLQMDSPKDPLQTCLIGLTWDIYKFRYYRPHSGPIVQFTDITQKFGNWITDLPSPPKDTIFHDVHLLMSTSPSVCFYFQNVIARPQARHPTTIVSPLNLTYYGPKWCLNASHSLTGPSLLRPRKLPPGIFLICGD